MQLFSSTAAVARSSWSVLRADRALLKLPLLASVLVTGIVSGFVVVVPRLLSTSDENLNAYPATSGGSLLVSLALLALAMVLAVFTRNFFNVALAYSVDQTMSGSKPTVRSAVRRSSKRTEVVGTWSFMSCTVSLLIRLLEEQLGLAGRIVGSLGGVAWNAATYLIVPVIALEDRNVGNSLSRAATLIRNCWGDAIRGYVGLSILHVIVSIITFLALLVLVLVAEGTHSTLFFIAIPLATFALIATNLLLGALSVVFQTALYRFAQGRDVAVFDHGLLQTAFFGPEASSAKDSNLTGTPAD